MLHRELGKIAAEDGFGVGAFLRWRQGFHLKQQAFPQVGCPYSGRFEALHGLDGLVERVAVRFSSGGYRHVVGELRLRPPQIAVRVEAPYDVGRGGGHFRVERPHGELAAQVIVDRLGIVGLCGLIEVVVRREIACLKPVVRYFVRIPVVGFLHFLRAFRESRPVVGGHGRLFFFGYAAGGFECRILGYFHFDGLLEFGRGKLQQLHEAELLLCKPHCCAQVCVEVLALAHVVWITRPAERPGCRKPAAVPQAECEVTIFLSYFIENA